jgi:hypothetical protein
MKNIWMYIILTITCCMTACGPSAIQDQLVSAETLMDEHPDSALSLLRTVDATHITSRKDKALYALLYSQALDKNFIDETNDSLIHIAVDYYSTSKDARRKFLSYYYWGVILSNKGDDERAIMAYTEAERIPSAIDPYLKGLLYTSEGQVYISNYAFKEALNAYSKAYTYYQKAGKESHAAYGLSYMAYSQCNMSHTKEAVQLYEQASALGQKMNDKRLTDICSKNLMLLYIELEDYSSADRYAGEFLDIQDYSQFSAITLTALAKLYTHKNEARKAETLLEQAKAKANSAYDSIHIYIAEAHYQQIQGNYAEAFLLYQKGIRMENKEIKTALQHPVVFYQEEYYREHNELNEQLITKGHQQFILLLIASILLIISLFASYFTLRQKIRIKNLELDKYIEISEELKEKLLLASDNATQSSNNQGQERQDGATTNNSLSLAIAKLLKGKFPIMDTLCNMSSDDTDASEMERVYKTLKTEIKGVFEDTNITEQLEMLVNEYKGNVMKIVRRDFPFYNEKDFTFLIYLYANFTPKTISFLTNLTEANVRTKKSRFRNKVLNSQSPDKDFIISQMQKR